MFVILGMVVLAAVLLIAGVPIAFAIGLAPVAVALVTGAIPVQVLTVQMVSTATSPLLLAIPLFVFASKIMEVGGLAADLVRLAELLVGKVRGGLGVAVVMASMLFSGMTGAKVAEVSAIAQSTVPPLRARTRRELCDRYRGGRISGRRVGATGDQHGHRGRCAEHRGHPAVPG